MKINSVVPSIGLLHEFDLTAIDFNGLIRSIQVETTTQNFIYLLVLNPSNKKSITKITLAGEMSTRFSIHYK